MKLRWPTSGLDNSPQPASAQSSHHPQNRKPFHNQKTRAARSIDSCSVHRNIHVAVTRNKTNTSMISILSYRWTHSPRCLAHLSQYGDVSSAILRTAPQRCVVLGSLLVSLGDIHVLLQNPPQQPHLMDDLTCPQAEPRMGSWIIRIHRRIPSLRLRTTVARFVLACWATAQQSPVTSFYKFTIEAMSPSWGPNSGERDRNLIFYVIRCFVVVRHNTWMQECWRIGDLINDVATILFKECSWK